MRTRLAVLALALPGATAAQEPLSAIEWLNRHPAGGGSGHVLMEPPVTETAAAPPISATPLERAAAPIGLVPARVTGLPENLWQASDGEDLKRLIAGAPVDESPAMQALLYTLLLSESLPPEGAAAAEASLLARIDRLIELGATEPAQALAEIAGPSDSPARFARWFDATLLNGDEDRGCAAINARPDLAPDYAARIFCQMRGGDWPTAALTLEAAHALDLLPDWQLALLDRFLSPDLFEGLPPLPRPDHPDPLSFRLFEAIGERLPTATLPRAFATADLRDLAGWKAQLEAAERLARSGAISPNQLLGLYSERLPAASGGIWDRVAALQRFETALNTGSAEAVAKTLPQVWEAMREVRLEVPFAALFAEHLAELPLTGETAALAFRIRLLSPGYEAASMRPPDRTPATRFLVALAQGEPAREPAPDPTARAIADGFSGATALPPEVQDALASGRLGEAILRGIALFDQGARGNPASLTAALAVFRAAGLEDTARRAALQLILLDRR